MKIRRLEPKDDTQIAAIIRYNLKANSLDIPGTVYFDEGLDHLSRFYSAEPGKCEYYVLTEDENEDKIIGGVGFYAFEFFDSCAELQKIYLDDTHKGQGLGKYLLSFIEERVRNNGYRTMYLETHTNLDTAIGMYRKYGYKEIERPACVMHGAMNVFLIKDL